MLLPLSMVPPLRISSTHSSFSGNCIPPSPLPCSSFLSLLLLSDFLQPSSLLLFSFKIFRKMFTLLHYKSITKDTFVFFSTLCSPQPRDLHLLSRDGNLTRTRLKPVKPAPFITRMGDENGLKMGMGRVLKKWVRIRVRV